MEYPLTAIISDLHGNVPALEVALADIEERGVERVVCLGDVVGYGSKPRQCLDVVMELSGPEPHLPGGERELEKGFCLLGNHEAALLEGAQDFNPKARAAIEWTRDELNVDPERRDAYWEFIDTLVPVLTDSGAMYAHGSPRDPVREYMLPRDIHDEEKMAAVFDSIEGPGVCFVGHSHVPAVYFEDRRLFRPKGTEGPFDLGELNEMRAVVNVGSVGQPRDGDSRLSYAVYDGRNITFVRLEYDIETVAAEIRAIPELPDYLADRLTVGR